MMRRVLITCALVAGLPLVALANFPITQIAITGDPAPGGGVFTSFGLPVADRDYTANAVFDTKDFYFASQTSSGASGVYGYDQYGTVITLGLIANTTMPAPTGGNYAGFSSLSVGNGELGFLATTTAGKQLLVAADANHSPMVIAQTGDSPSPGKTFGSFQSLSVMEGGFGTAAMEGEINTDIGIYDYDYPSGSVQSGPLTFSKVADTSTVPPGASSPFTSFGPPSFEAERNSLIQGRQSKTRAVRATVGGVEGIYYGQAGHFLNTPAPLVNLVSAGMATPDGAGIFTSFGDPTADFVNIYFIAQYHTAAGEQQGTFWYGPYGDFGDQPELHLAAATGDIAPGSNGARFASFHTSTDIGYFTATLGNGVEGLYGADGGLNIIDTTDRLDGKSISNIDIEPQAVGDTGIAFKVDFTDGSQGLFFWNLQAPEPSTFSLLALPALWFLRRRHRGRITPGEPIRGHNSFY